MDKYLKLMNKNKKTLFGGGFSDMIKIQNETAEDHKKKPFLIELLWNELISLFFYRIAGRYAL